MISVFINKFESNRFLEIVNEGEIFRVGFWIFYVGLGSLFFILGVGKGVLVGLIELSDVWAYWDEVDIFCFYLEKVYFVYDLYFSLLREEWVMFGWK